MAHESGIRSPFVWFLLVRLSSLVYLQSACSTEAAEAIGSPEVGPSGVPRVRPLLRHVEIVDGYLLSRLNNVHGHKHLLSVRDPGYKL